MGKSIPLREKVRPQYNPLATQYIWKLITRNAGIATPGLD